MGGRSFGSSSSIGAVPRTSPSLGSGSSATLGGRTVSGYGAAPAVRNSGFFLLPTYGYGYGYGGYGYGGGFGGGGIFSLLLLGFVAYSVVSMLRGAAEEGGGGLSLGGESISVVAVQVGLLGSARQMQQDLEKIAGKADTSTTSGLKFVLSETALALLRNPEYCVYASAQSKSAKGPQEAEAIFDELSMGERSKFEAETLTAVDGSRREAAVDVSRTAGDRNEYILVTVLAAADGSVRMPQVDGNEDLKTALKRLGAIPPSSLQAVEVLWTPQADGDTLTAEEMMRDYPTLRLL